MGLLLVVASLRSLDRNMVHPAVVVSPAADGDGNGAYDMGKPAAFASPCNLDEDDWAGGRAVR